MSKYDPRRFAILDFIGAFFWALAFGLAGKLIGHLMGTIFEDVREHEPMIVAGILIAGVCAGIYLRYANRVKKDKAKE
jgi:membrane protein DedA with SNARE-associated domain